MRLEPRFRLRLSEMDAVRWCLWSEEEGGWEEAFERQAALVSESALCSGLKPEVGSALMTACRRRVSSEVEEIALSSKSSASSELEEE